MIMVFIIRFDCAASRQAVSCSNVEAIRGHASSNLGGVAAVSGLRNSRNNDSEDRDDCVDVPFRVTHIRARHSNS
jgi:hypothetical protein